MEYAIHEVVSSLLSMHLKDRAPVCSPRRLQSQEWQSPGLPNQRVEGLNKNCGLELPTPIAIPQLRKRMTIDDSHGHRFGLRLIKIRCSAACMDGSLKDWGLFYGVQKAA